MSEDTTTTEAPEAEGAEAEPLDELDQEVAEVCEEYEGAANALAALLEARNHMASEAECHPEQLPESRRDFQLRRKLEIRAAQENKATAHEAAMDTRRGQRLNEVEAADVHNRRNRLADMASKRELEKRVAKQPTHGGEGEEEYTAAAMAKYAEDDAEHTDQVAADDAEHQEDVDKEKAAQREADTSDPPVVKDKMAKPENLDGLNVGALKALAKAHQLKVERTDGQPGAPRREDYVAALTA